MNLDSMPARSSMRVLWGAFAVFLLGQVPLTAFILQSGYLSRRPLLTACGASVVVVGLLTSRVRRHACPHRFVGPILWPILLGVIAYLTMTLRVPEVILLTIGVQLAVAVAILSFFLDRLTSLIAAITSNPSGAPVLVFFLLGLTAMAPLWLAPWAEYLANSQLVSDSIIGVSPLTYLTIMADFDYLRSQWYYRNTPFGGLRFSYPGQSVLSTVYLSLGLLLWVVEAIRGRRATKTPAASHDLEE